MRIACAVVGTRGDVQPLLALASALRRRGHECLVCAPANFREAARARGVPFEALCSDFEMFLRLRGGFRMVCRIGGESGRMFDVFRRAARGADAIVHAMMDAAAPSIAQALGVPLFTVVYSPTLLCSDAHWPIVGIPGHRPSPRWLNRLVWRASRAAWNRAYRREVNEQRAILRLPPIADAHHYLFHSGKVLVAVDPEIAPVTEIPGQPTTATGFWFEEDEGVLAPEIEAFLDAGPPPIYVGFGSMIARRPSRLAETILAAIRATGARAIVGAGLARLVRDGLPERCLAVAEAPHAALFPRVAAVAHHGGAGTFASAARAGAPQVVVPHLGDQNYWGQRARALGIGTKPIFAPFLTAERLAKELRTAASDTSMRNSARAIAARLSGNRGIDEAVRRIEACAKA